MGIQEAYRNFIYRINKLGTNSNQNVPYPQFVALMNKATLHWVEARIKVAEQTETLSEELRQILEEYKPSLITYQNNIYKITLPINYFHYCRFYANVVGCKSKVYGKLVEEGNINTLLQGSFTGPSSAWEEVLVTLFNKGLRVYTDGFSLEMPVLNYYRYPIKVDIAGYTKEDGSSSVNVDLEFDGVDAYEIVDLAAQFATVDIADFQRYQVLTNQINTHN